MKIFRHINILCTIAAATACSTQAHAAGTLAGTDISLKVSVSFWSNGNTSSFDAETAKVVVDRAINMTFERAYADDNRLGLKAGSKNGRVSFRLTNLSNTKLTFEIGHSWPAQKGGSFTIDDQTVSHDFDNSYIDIYYDSNDNKRLDTDGSDARVLKGVGAPAVVTLEPDASGLLFFQPQIPDNVPDGSFAIIIPYARPSYTMGEGDAMILTGPMDFANNVQDLDGMDSSFLDPWSIDSPANDGMITSLSNIRVGGIDGNYLRSMQSIKATNSFATNLGIGSRPIVLPSSSSLYCIGYYNPPDQPPIEDMKLNFTIPPGLAIASDPGVFGGTYPLAESEFGEQRCEANLEQNIDGSFTGDTNTGGTAEVSIPNVPAGHAAYIGLVGTVK